jgi:hypothetical protein
MRVDAEMRRAEAAMRRGVAEMRRIETEIMRARPDMMRVIRISRATRQIGCASCRRFGAVQASTTTSNMTLRAILVGACGGL